MTGGFERRGTTTGLDFSGGTVTGAFLTGAALLPLAGAAVLLLFCASTSGGTSKRSNARMESKRTKQRLRGFGFRGRNREFTHPLIDKLRCLLREPSQPRGPLKEG